MDLEYSPFIIMFHLLQPQPQPDPPTPSISSHRVPSQHPPALLAAMTQSPSCWGYKRIKSLMKNSQESDFSQSHTMRCAPADVDAFYSLIHPWQQNGETAWSASEILFHRWRCLWRHHWVTWIDDFLRANLSDTRHTWNWISRPWGDNAVDQTKGYCVIPHAKASYLCKRLAHNGPSLLEFLSHQPKLCSDSEEVGDNFASCMSESSLCWSLTHQLRFWSLWVVRTLLY